MAQFAIRLSDEELADIDRCRGTVARERWMKELARMAVWARDNHGAGCFLRMYGSNEPGDAPKLEPLREPVNE